MFKIAALTSCRHAKRYVTRRFIEFAQSCSRNKSLNIMVDHFKAETKMLKLRANSPLDIDVQIQSEVESM